MFNCNLCITQTCVHTAYSISITWFGSLTAISQQLAITNPRGSAARPAYAANNISITQTHPFPPYSSFTYSFPIREPSHETHTHTHTRACYTGCPICLICRRYSLDDVLLYISQLFRSSSIN